jgi:hypothetical protein
MRYYGKQSAISNYEDVVVWTYGAPTGSASGGSPLGHVVEQGPSLM